MLGLALPPLAGDAKGGLRNIFDLSLRFLAASLESECAFASLAGAEGIL
jgi:hypothetical protein